MLPETLTNVDIFPKFLVKKRRRLHRHYCRLSQKFSVWNPFRKLSKFQQLKIHCNVGEGYRTHIFQSFRSRYISSLFHVL